MLRTSEELIKFRNVRVIIGVVNLCLGLVRLLLRGNDAVVEVCTLLSIL